MVAELLRAVGWRDDEHFEWQPLQLQPDQLQDPCSQQDVPWHWGLAVGLATLP